MPWNAEHKARTRARIVDAARRLFNRHGFQEVTIERIMTGAGLTRGGFYHHFDSKDALYAEAVASYATCNPFVRGQRTRKRPPGDPRLLARSMVRLYLSDEVLADDGLHCPLYALPSDIARAGPSPRAAYTALIRGMMRIHRRALAGARDADRRAQAIVSLCVGGMVLARTTSDPALCASLRRAARRQALALLDG